jgi:hypothetical protein
MDLNMEGCPDTGKNGSLRRKFTSDEDLQLRSLVEPLQALSSRLTRDHEIAEDILKREDHGV